MSAAIGLYGTVGLLTGRTPPPCSPFFTHSTAGSLAPRTAGRIEEVGTLECLANDPWVLQSHMYRIVACLFLGHSKFQLLSFACRTMQPSMLRSI